MHFWRSFASATAAHRAGHTGLRRVLKRRARRLDGRLILGAGLAGDGFAGRAGSELDFPLVPSACAKIIAPISYANDGGGCPESAMTPTDKAALPIANRFDNVDMSPPR